MVEDRREPMLLVTSAEELPLAERIWGTGGWLPPERREALDWLTLARLRGWGVTVGRPAGPDPGAELSGGSHWVVVARDPDSLGAEATAFLASRLAVEPLVVVARAGACGGTFARLAGAGRSSGQVSGGSLRWTGPGPTRQWQCRKSLDAHALEVGEEAVVWAGLDDAPLITARGVGCGLVVTVGCHPSEARDADSAATALLAHLLTWASLRPVAWLDLANTLVLRMDDPGGSQNVYSRQWCYPKLGATQWAALGDDLKRRDARLSIAYVSGWVDDGDPARGELWVDGHRQPRVPGSVYASPLVQYQDRVGHASGVLHDYASEYRGIQALLAAGLADVELHGYTHLHPERGAWARAADRYDAIAWYRELGQPAEITIAHVPPEEHPLALGIAALKRHFDTRPTTLVPPGDEWTNPVLERALDLGLHLVDSYYLALRNGDRFCWCSHVCAPYLDEPDAAWFAAGLPVVGYFHDREPALEGVGWVSRWLDRWQAAGARRLLDFRELAVALGRRLCLEEGADGPRLLVRAEDAPSLVRPLAICCRWPGQLPPSRLAVCSGDREDMLEVHSRGDSIGEVRLPGPGDGVSAQ